MPGSGAKIDGVALAAAGAGALFIYAGVTGRSALAELQAFIQGKSPQSVPVSQGIQGASTTPSSQGLTGSPLAQDLLNYVGKAPYKWGGGNPSGWDCSGAVNYVANHIAGLPIPAYAKPHSFTGATHGPSTLMWLAWAPAHMLKISAGNVQAGDLVIWQTHMGIAINGTQYVSAYDTAEGTVVHPIHGGGPVGEIATFWRYKFGTPGSNVQNPNPLTGATT